MTSPRFQFSLRGILAITLLLGILLGLEVNIQLNDERTSRDARLIYEPDYRETVFEAIALYIQFYPGEWPKSFDELCKKGFLECNNLPEIMKSVSVNFTLTLQDVAAQDPSKFTAIKGASPLPTDPERARLFQNVVKNVLEMLSKRK